MFVNNQESASGKNRCLGTILCAILVSLFLAGVPAWAQEAETGKKPLKLGSSKTASKPKGLAGYASAIKLKKSDSLTISNSSIKNSSKGTLSIGGGVTTGGAPPNTAGGLGGIGEPSKAETWNKEYDDQKKRNKDLEKSMAENTARQQKQTDPYLASAYNRPPGVASPYDVDKAKAAKELENERQRLEKMRREARRDGVDLRRR